MTTLILKKPRGHFPVRQWPVEDLPTVYSEFHNTTCAYSDNLFLHIPKQATAAYQEGPVDLTYHETLEQVSALSARYGDAGYGPGHRVALVLENRAEFFLHFLALNCLGVSIVPVNAEFPDDSIAHIISHSDSSLIVTLPEYKHKIDVSINLAKRDIAVTETPRTKHIPHAGTEPDSGVPDKSTEAALLYTSGTTGRPKGCMLSNEYFLTIGDWYVNLGGYCELENGRERLITPLPLVHMNALCTSTMGMIMSGGCVIQLDRFHAGNWWETVRASKATCAHLLGVMPAILLNFPGSTADDFHKQVKFGFCSGTDPKHHKQFEKRFGFPLIEGWAMTETGTVTAVITQHEPRYTGTRCVGKPSNKMEYRLVDEQGNDVNNGESGEILVRVAGENPRRGFFSGYYKNAEETEKVWEGGWFHTGDVMRLDENGYLHFVDRRKNIIRRSGENISAVEVEAVLFRNAMVANCAVTPVYDEFRGEEVCACIILAENTPASKDTAEKIFTFCNDCMIYYKVPGYYLFLSELPISATQKIQRGAVKKLAGTHVENNECIDLRKLKVRKRPDH